MKRPYSPITNSIIPDSFDFYWKPPAAVYNLAKAKQLLAEAGFPKGFDAGDYSCDSSYANLGEAVLNNLQEVGIRVKLRPLERAAFFSAYGEKKLKNIIQGASGAFGNTATRLEAFVVKGGAYVYGSYPEIDTLFAEQAVELDVAKRTKLLDRAQQIVHGRHLRILANGGAIRLTRARPLQPLTYSNCALSPAAMIKPSMHQRVAAENHRDDWP